MSRRFRAIFLGVFMLGISSTVVLGDLVEDKTIAIVARNLAPFIGVAVVFAIVALVIILSVRKKNR